METIILARGRTRAVVVPEAGGRLHQLSIRDGDRWLSLLRKPASLDAYQRDPTTGGSFVMAPWPGRIDGGRFLWRGRFHEVPVNAGSHALHGRALYQPWQIESRTANACRLSVVFDDGWPWCGRAEQEIVLVDGGIRQTVRVEALGGARFPCGVGWHPWFRRNVGGRTAEICVNAACRYELADMIPTGWLARVGGDLDLRGYCAVTSQRIDDCYRHPQGPLRMRWGAIELRMQSSSNVTHAVVYTPPGAVCIEPQTCAPDAFNLDAQGADGAGTFVVDREHPLMATTTWGWTIETGAR